ncbi:MAG: EF-hand domain-containing protein [Rhodanobacteraceae bacterium]|jgi:uncharacterized low-complexity protein|nr:EF-hand domain-containing protein [Rhodanobacteraceae bacterium]
MSSKLGNTLGVAIGATLIGSLSLSQLAAASPAFQVGDLAAGYMLAAGAEGKCGEGKCGMAAMDKNKDGKVSADEAKAMGMSEAMFKSADTNGDGVLDAAEVKAHHAAMHKDGGEGSCGSDMAKGSEGSCGGAMKAADAKKKDAEGSCGGHKGGEGGCGAMKG